MAVPYKLNYFEIESGLGTTSTFLHKGDFTANKIIKIGGTSNDILLGDGSTTSLSGIITLASFSASAPLAYNNTTGQFSISQASSVLNGYLSSADWIEFSNKQGAITLTTTGSSGAATLIGNTLNIPNYSPDLTGYVTLGTTQTITGAKTFQATATFNVVNNPSINAVNGDNLAISAQSATATAIQAISNSGRGIKAESTSNIAADFASSSGVGLSVTSLSNTIANFYGASFALKASISQAGDITGNSFIKTGGLSTQFLKADGSVDSNTYLTSASLTGYVPYTGASANVNLGVHNLLANAITLDPTPATIPTAQGSMYFDEDEKTIAAVLNGSVMKIGEDSFFQIKNQSGATIPKGTAVRFDGVVGSSGRVLAVPFLADGTYPSLYFLGVTYESIPDGGDGKALILGKIRGINTNAYIAGTILYASTTVAGGYQTTPPIAPNNIISVAAVVTQGVSNGTILVRPQLGSNINNDEGVKIVTPVTGDLLQLQAGGLWENKSVASLSLVPQSRTLSINGTSYDLTANRSWSVGTITSLTGEATASGSGAVSVTLDNTAVTGKLLTGLNITGGTVVSTDSILTAFGKLQNELNGLIGGSVYQGIWNASTNTPTLTSSVGTKGHYYIVSAAGSTNLNGITEWSIGDWAIYDGSAWQKVDNTDSVVTVNGYAGIVSLVTGDVLEGAGTLPGRPSQLYFTDARARAALSFAAGSGAYNTTTGVITIPTNNNQITNGSNYITLTSLSASSPLAYNNTTGVFTIQQANSIQGGFLSSADWIEFNNKVSVATLANYVTLNTAQSITGNKTFSGSTLRVDVVGTSAISSFTNNSTSWSYSPSLNSVGFNNSNNFYIANVNGNGGIFTFSNPTTVVSYAFPATSGTVALTSNLSAYLPLTGGTLTGALNGTSATFSGRVGVALSSSGVNLSNSSFYINNTAGTKGSLFGYNDTNDEFYIISLEHGVAYKPITITSSNFNLTRSGNLGLGVTPSAWDSGQKVYQSGLGSFYGLADGGATIVVNNGYYNAGWKYSSTNPSGVYQIVGNSHQWLTAPSGTAGNAISFTQAMTLDASGNLLVGTTSGTLNGVVTIAQRSASGNGSSTLSFNHFKANNNYINFGWYGSSLGSISQKDGSAIQITAPNGLHLQPSGGNVGIGTTSPSTKLEVIANANTFQMARFENTNNTSGNGVLVTNSGSNCNNTSSYHLIAATGGADKFYLYGNGTYTTVSDSRLKKDISKVTDNYLEKVLALNTVNYHWNDQNENDALEFGMIAQEVEELIPSIVHEGREDENGNKYKGIQASVLPYILIKAIQESVDIINDLKSRIEKLESK